MENFRGVRRIETTKKPTIWFLSKPHAHAAPGVEEMNGKRSKITMTVLILVLIFQACYIVLVTMVPDPGSRMYLLRNLTPAPYMKMEPASFELLAMLASQRYGAESALVKYMRERFGDNPELAEYLEWLEGHLEEGKRGTMDDLAELKSFLDQGGKLDGDQHHG